MFDEINGIGDTHFLAENDIDLSAKTIRKRYPLPDKEALWLFGLLAVENVVFVVVGALLGMAFASTSAIEPTVRALSGAPYSLFSPDALSSPRFWTVTALAFAFALAFNVAVEKTAMARSGKYRDDMLANRQGVSGELARMPLGTLAALCAFVGVGEEMVFRYGLAVLVMSALSFFSISGLFAYLLAALVLSGGFASIHMNYTSDIAKLQVFTAGLILALALALSGSIYAAMIVHALYDFSAFLLSRRTIMKGDDPFRGKVPARIITAKSRF